MINKEDKILPIQSSLKLQSYFCPHCKKFLMKGAVKRLNMTCPNCQKMIDADERALLKPEIPNTPIESGELNI